MQALLIVALVLGLIYMVFGSTGILVTLGLGFLFSVAFLYVVIFEGDA